MNLIKTSFLSAVATVIKVINSFVIVKVVAVFVGPSGLAFIGQFQNFISILMTFATGAINTGVVKYTAEYSADEGKKKGLWSTALRISLGMSVLVSLLLLVFHSDLSMIFFKSDEYKTIFIVFAFTLTLFVLNALLVAILNGQKEIKKLITVNITSSFAGLALTGILAYQFGLYGALLSYSIGQGLIFFVTLSFVFKSKWFKAELFTSGIDRSYVKKLGKFTLMAVITALTLPLSQIVIRNYIGDSISWDAAGYWNGVWKISTTYLMLVTTVLSVYYLPRLSEIKDNGELRSEIMYGYKIILPIAVVMAVGIYILRDFVILTLFTEQFMPMSDLFFYQLIGDVFKIASWLLGCLLIAKAMTKVFIVTEIAFALTFVCLSYFMLEWNGLIGVTQAFAISYIMYFVAMLFIFRSTLRGQRAI